MSKYDSYKESGVEWIGEIPSHWNYSKVGRHFEIGRGRVISKIEIDDNKGDYPVYSSQTSNNGELGRINTYDFEGEYVTWTTDGAHTGTCFFREGKFNTTNVCGMLSQRNTPYSLRFLSFYLNQVTKPYVRIDINPKLMNNMMSEIPLIIPPILEQEQIVSFLDNKTSWIDTLIEKTRRRIDVLKEKRTSLIHHVVTKGLNPEVELKDSGVEWIGKIPSNWEMKKVKYLFEIRKRISGELGYKVLSVTQKGLKVKDTISGKGQISMDYSKYQFVHPGDFVMNHMDLLTGYVDVSDILGVTSPDYRVFTLTDKRSVKDYYLRVFQYGYYNKIFFGFGQGSSKFGRWRLPSRQFNNFRFPYPSFEEQQEIVDYLNEQTSNIDTTINKEQKRIDLLKEYRHSLVSEVVTGKIKVTTDE
jgi:type I restriction enzyme, S subunit